MNRITTEQQVVAAVNAGAIRINAADAVAAVVTSANYRITGLDQIAAIVTPAALRVAAVYEIIARSVADAIIPPGAEQRLLAWDEANIRRPYRWRSKLYLNPIPASYTMAQVRAIDYDDLTLRIYAQGQLILERVVTSDIEFTIPIVEHTRTEIEIEGTSTVQTVQLVEDVREFT